MQSDLHADNDFLKKSASIMEDLLAKCHGLLEELEQFREFLVKRNKEQTVELRPFRNSIQSELKLLERLSEADPSSERTIHTVRSSNLPFYSAVWTAAKSSTGILLFNKRFYWETPPKRSSNRAGRPRKRCALVDVVAQNGEEWIKVSTITETRLLFEKAKVGWEGADSDTDDDEDGMIYNGLQHVSIDDPDENTNGDRLDDDDDRIELLKMAEDLKRASLATRVRYKHPNVRFVLPKITEGHVPEIDSILASIRATGATVETATTIISQLSTKEPLPAIFSRLIINPFTKFTPTLNIDCTILLALVSDLSHEAITPESWFHRATRRQIELESKEQLLPTLLWPAIAGSKTLVCTSLAAKRMREIVDTIGTPSERMRTDLLFATSSTTVATPRYKPSQSSLLAAFSSTTMHPVPPDWSLPIRTIPFDPEACLAELPPVATKVAAQLTEINKSVFLFGWVNRWTTISSNRTVAKLIEGVVEAESAGEGKEDVVGPDVWLCGTARSLVGKEKGRGG